ncbi:SPFH domain-containing protein [Gluconacetobacter diazotrophicus]|uniref:SPFH domain-containing protein n=1 Tax=Gluconacetobacter diazotrophicus TaxID=33996 RepID=UPI00119A1F43|nr:SPFH domain-containing protein [Gluconacetobacter diazotrophicus]TWB11271.1 SPFH domain/Band 7 family protein [Gluconacetobacter diazotrophicus]
MNAITLVLSAALLLAGLLFGGLWSAEGMFNPAVALPFLALSVLVFLSLRMANVWEKFVVLRMGRLQGVRGPGLFMIVPVIDRIVAIIDERIQTTGFNAEQALTRDTVPVNVDAVIFWHVRDAEAAALRIIPKAVATDSCVK